MVGFSLAKSIKEIRRRRVFGVLALYVVGAWVLLQVADLAFPGLGIPESAIRYVWIGAILGLPVALVFGWRFDITSQGIRRTPTGSEETTALPLSTPDYFLLLVLSTATIAMIILLALKIMATQGIVETLGGVAELPVFDPPEYSIAVLPFDNLSSDPEQEYFVAGMHDALIAELARISNLVVISKTSTLHFKGTTLTIPQIARELNVAMIVEGSVFKLDGQIRIQVQLIASQPERHLLAETYDRDLSSILELQGKVTQDIAKRIQVTLTPQEQSRLTDAPTVDSETYTLWLKGNYHLGRLNEDSFRNALASYQQAIDRDPTYAPAYAGLALAYIRLGGWHSSESPDDVIRPARKAAEQALALDPAVAEAHLALGTIRSQFDWDWAGADRAFMQGITLNPNDTQGRIEYANFLTAMGRFQESIDIGRRTLELDPLSPMAYNELGFAHWFAGNDDEALALYLEGLKIDPDFPQSLVLLSAFHIKNGEFDKALTYLARMNHHRQTPPPNSLGLMGRFLALAGREAEARDLLSQLLERRAREFIPANAVAGIYLGLGEHDEALRWFELAYEEHDVSLIWLKELWVYDLLRDDSRFQAILDRLDFPEP
jgi:TolB-like protein/Flp pilus assembly protein TadD